MNHNDIESLTTPPIDVERCRYRRCQGAEKNDCSFYRIAGQKILTQVHTFKQIQMHSQKSLVFLTLKFLNV